MRTKSPDSKGITVRFRINKSELELLESKMKKEKYETYSDYIRAKAIGKVKSKKKAAKTTVKFNGITVAENG